MKLHFTKFGRQHALRRRLHSAAAVLLLGLYAAAVWHGAGDHHGHALDAHAGCGTHVCGADLSPEPAHGADDDEHSDAHACALCTLLHAPATPGLMAAAPAVQPASQAALPASASVVSVELVGNMPARAPPFLSA